MTRFLAMLALLATPAWADGVINGVPVDCYCTDKQGQRVEVGEMICLQVDGRMFMAQCQMSLNVPMWREISPGCLSSGLLKPSPSAPLQSFDPAVHPRGIHAKIL
ncbi:hypothetical protein [Shimia marina]|uniref:Integral membrane protein n=1 Tax=Shimia marina TaxID=321267 RepID=A0A0P1ERW7_9RHOB|nr:hypothetical protein [Shimia marina]CUH53269.1 hypothetical protein SHM7688_02722 [Shimia marina]SFD81097.1 hypothetical protein SAMN04488037_102549 [Shimia marina]